VRRHLRARGLLGAVLSSLALLSTIGAFPVAAWSPQLTAQLTDEAGVLGGDRVRVQAGLDGLFEAESVRLWIVLVRTTGSSRAPDLARQLFEENGLGGQDLLLVVAVDDHRYGWWERTVGGSDTGEATGLSTYEIDALMGNDMEPNFRAGDYAGGLVSLSAGLATAVHQARNSDWAANGGGAEESDTDVVGWLWLIPLLMAAGVLGIIFIAAVAKGSGGGYDGGGVGWSGWSGSTDSGGSSASSGYSSSSSGYSSSDDSSGHGGGGGWADSGGGGSSGDDRSGGGHGAGGGW
jgi:hypothetical protein